MKTYLSIDAKAEYCVGDLVVIRDWRSFDRLCEITHLDSLHYFETQTKSNFLTLCQHNTTATLFKVLRVKYILFYYYCTCTQQFKITFKL